MTRAAFLCLLFMGACAPREFDLLSHPLNGSGSVAELTHGHAFSVIMIADPADAFACGNHISRWIEWRRRNPGQFMLVFTRPPTDTERRQLLLFRLHPDGTLRPGADVPGGMREVLVAQGRVVLTNEVPPGQPDSPLLRALEQGRAAELLGRQGLAFTAGS